jgi:hypothetical protein
MLGCMSREAAQRTMAGVEVMHMIKKEEMLMEGGAQGQTPVQ